jgi:hypothetical protein
MKLRLLFLLLTICCIFTSRPVAAQTLVFTPEDLGFFQNKAKAYQRWLDQTGLGGALQVYKTRLNKNDTEVELLLRVHSTDLDTAIALWNRAKDDYLLSSGRTLEEALFQTFASFMEIPPAQGNVQVYVLDTNGLYIQCFYIGIWEEQGEIRTRAQLRDCKDQPIEIALKPRPLQKTAKAQTTWFQRTLDSEQVFNGIEAFLRNKYLTTACYDRYPELVVEQRTETFLKISISDLCKVVLKDERNSPWCATLESLGWNCNDARRERLEFRFLYLSGSNQLSGYLTGKFGSGVYRPRKSGYMDMEPDFNDYLEKFHLKFQRELKTYLERL